MKPVYVIFIALEEERFDYVLIEPQCFYESFMEAEKQMNHLIKTKEYQRQQLKIRKLWIIPNNKPL